MSEDFIAYVCTYIHQTHSKVPSTYGPGRVVRDSSSGGATEISTERGGEGEREVESGGGGEGREGEGERADGGQATPGGHCLHGHPPETTDCPLQ